MKTWNKIIYDTSSLLEMFLGTSAGEQVKELFIDENTENLIPTVVFSELISKLKRSAVDPMLFIDTLEKNALILELDMETSKNAGFIHAGLKSKEPKISLIDCIIMAHADVEDALILTLDSHFSHYKNAKLL